MAQHQRGDHYDHLRHSQTKHQVVAGHKSDQRDDRYRQGDSGQYRTKEEIHCALNLIVQHRLQCPQPFRRENQQRHQETSKGHRRVHAGQQRLQRVGVHFGDRNHRHQMDNQPDRVPHAAVRRRLTVVRVIIVAVIFVLVDKQALVSFGLN